MLTEIITVGKIGKDTMETNGKLYWKDSKGKWHFVEDIKPIEDFEKQLKMIEKDEYGYMCM